jgi:hypothetical protein
MRTVAMLTRREILNQLRTQGVKEASLLKIYLRDIEKYMETNYGIVIIKGKRQKDDLLELRKDPVHP